MARTGSNLFYTLAEACLILELGCAVVAGLLGNKGAVFGVAYAIYHAPHS